MFEDKIQQLRNHRRNIDAKLCKKLGIEQFENLLSTLSDQGLIDNGEVSKGLQMMIEGLYRELRTLHQEHDFNKKAMKSYKKSYAALLARVRELYALEPSGSIQSRYTALGMVFGSSIGSLLLAFGNATMMSLGISLGLVFGAGIGSQKEKEAKEAGKVF
ncbi:hypothetical protein SANA_01620 [Gottschalkiaceae bacterium SANA]|nr:hypothetical protein SANA_01620 [Gottschalkiaceae bacterium SANA]